MSFLAFNGFWCQWKPRMGIAEKEETFNLIVIDGGKGEENYSSK